jgi:hypothetical protein
MNYMARAVKEWGGRPLDMLPYAMSGTRIAAMGYADEGAVVFQTLRDTQLGFDCAFAKSETGELHCAPSLRTHLLFSDAQCTDPAAPGENQDGSGAAPLLQTGDYVTPVRFLSKSEQQGAELPQHGPVYRVAEKLSETHYVGAAEDAPLFELNGDHCVTTMPRVAKSVPSIYRLKPVPDSELVSANIKEIPLEGGLTLERLVGSDGSEISSGLKLNAVRCLLQPDGKCVPLPIAEVLGFADSECTDVGYYLDVPPASNVKVHGLSYGSESSVYELRPTEALYYEKEEYKPIFENGQMDVMRIVLGCFPKEPLPTSVPFYRRDKDVSAQMLTIGKIQLGVSRLRPEWFSAKVAGSNVSVLVRSYLNNAGTILTNDGKECSIAGAVCYFPDGTSLRLSEVKL